MITPVSVIIQNRYSIESCGVGDITLEQVRKSIDLNTTLFLVINDGEKTVDLDLSLLLLETPAGQSQTWDEFCSALTEENVMAYQQKRPSSKIRQNSIQSVSALGDLDFEIHYTSTRTPETRDVIEFKRRLNDLVVASVNPEKDINKYFGIVNGLVCRPVLFKDELYLRDGARMMWGNNDKHQAGIVLIDFSPLGGYDVVRMGDCKIEGNTESGRIEEGCQIIMTLPDEVDFNEVTPFLVIANKLFLPDQFQSMGKRTIMFNPVVCNVKDYLIQRYDACDRYINGTDVLQENIETDEYFRTIKEREDLNESFIILAKCSSIFIERNTDEIFNDFANRTINATNASDGILINTRSNSIVDYVSVEYESNDHLYVDNGKDRIKTSNLLTGTQNAVRKNVYDSHKYTTHSNCENSERFNMVYVSRKE